MGEFCYLMFLTYLWSMLLFYTPILQILWLFGVFLGGVKLEHWTEIG